MSFVNRQFYFFLFNLYAFLPLLALLYCLEPPVQCWTKVRRVNMIALSLILGGKNVNMSPLSIMLDVFYMPFVRPRKFHSVSDFLRVFIMDGYWILSFFFCIHLNDCIFLSFILLIWWITFTGFYFYIKPTLHSSDKPPLVMVYF